MSVFCFFFFQAEDGIRDYKVTGVQTCALPISIPEKQAAAAVGQSALMWQYEAAFSRHGIPVGQVLLTAEDVSVRARYLNARNTLDALLRFGVVTIVNENDTVAVEEIKVGDNDNLSALVASLIDADLLVLLTDVDGLYTDDPTVNARARKLETVEAGTDEIARLARDRTDGVSVGGVATELPSGILEVEGDFASGEVVALLAGAAGREFARGLVNFDADEVRKIRGAKTAEIEGRLGYRSFDEVIHRDNLVIL